MTGESPMEVTQRELGDFLGRIQARLEPEDYQIAQSLVTTTARLSQLLEDKTMSIDRLRKALFGAATETRDKVLPGRKGPKKRRRRSPKKRKGHGRNGADAYTGAENVPVPLPEVTAGDGCPCCDKGKVYRLSQGARAIRVRGQPFLAAKLYECERWRCNLCGEVFTADLPEEAGTEKYDASAGSMIAVLKYGSGFPFYRMARHQQDQGVPVPASVQWDIVDEVARKIAPVHEELIRQAAQGEVLHNDDTTMKILGLVDEDSGQQDTASSKRTGTFTTGIVSTATDEKIALFFTGRKHAGENLAEVLERREPERAAPIQMSDALSRNLPGEFETILANCIAHGRRKFVEVAPNFPDECARVLDDLARVYKTDSDARKRVLDPEERLRLHQDESAPVMKDLKSWLESQLEERLVEPNSSLGKAINYMLAHWEALTLFLRVPGAPLDNNVCERALKMAILHRKNSMFFKTKRGAAVGDLFMSLIYTCRLREVNPFTYLRTLIEHAKELGEEPGTWLPWNYKSALGYDDTG